MSRGNPNSLVVRYMNYHNKIWTFMVEFHVRSISPLHLKDFQLLWSSYIGLHKLRMTYAFPLSINLSLVKYWRQNIIILDGETSNLPTSKLQPVNVWNTRMEQEITLKKIFGCISIVKYIFCTSFLHLLTGEMPSCGIHHGMHCLLR